MCWGQMLKEEEKQEEEDCKRNRIIDKALEGRKKPSDEYIVRKLRTV